MFQTTNQQKMVIFPYFTHRFCWDLSQRVPPDQPNRLLQLIFRHVIVGGRHGDDRHRGELQQEYERRWCNNGYIWLKYIYIYGSYMVNIYIYMAHIWLIFIYIYIYGSYMVNIMGIGAWDWCPNVSHHPTQKGIGIEYLQQICEGDVKQIPNSWTFTNPCEYIHLAGAKRREWGNDPIHNDEIVPFSHSHPFPAWNAPASRRSSIIQGSYNDHARILKGSLYWCIFMLISSWWISLGLLHLNSRGSQTLGCLQKEHGTTKNQK